MKSTSENKIRDQVGVTKQCCCLVKVEEQDAGIVAMRGFCVSGLVQSGPELIKACSAAYRAPGRVHPVNQAAWLLANDQRHSAGARH